MNSNLISAFFVIYLAVFSIILVKYVPSFYVSTRNQFLSEVKFKSHYLSEYFSNQWILQILLIINQILLAFIIYNLASLIKQRMSVPEFNKDKGKFNLLVFSLLSETLFQMQIIFQNDTFLQLSRNYLKLTDNILTLCLIISIFGICLTTYLLLLRLDISGLPKESYYLHIKSYLLTIMGVTLFHYVVCLLLSSYYNPVIYIEKLMLGFIITCKEANLIVFFLCYFVFIISMKYDFYYLYLNLNVRPDIEFFIGDEDDSTILLKK